MGLEGRMIVLGQCLMKCVDEATRSNTMGKIEYVSGSIPQMPHCCNWVIDTV